ncbi:unnamed protein product, partial [Allacma fusca]
MGACDWICCCCSDDKDEAKPDPHPPADTSPTKAAPGKLVIRIEPGKANFKNKDFSPLTPRTPANEIPPYICKVKPLISEPSFKNLTFNVRKSRDTLISRPDIVQKLDTVIEDNKKIGFMTTTVSQDSTVIHDGIGKTETVRKYIEAHSHRYNHIVWIDAESRITVQNSFLNLAESIGKYIYDEAITDKYKRVSSLAKETFRVLMKKPCLIVLDNLSQEFSNFKSPAGSPTAREFLPTFLEDRIKPVILVISNDPGWTANTVKINQVPEDICSLFILNQLKIEDTDENRQLALEITKMTSRSPLFLEMTVGLIRIQVEEDTIGLGQSPMRDFIEFFQQSQRRVLPLRPTDSKTDPYLHVLLTLTINKIKEDSKLSRIAMNSLNAMAYMHSVKIPKKMLASFFPLESSKSITEALKILINYSLVQDVDEFLEMHPIVQEAIREIVKMNSREDKVLDWIIKEISCLLQQISITDKHYREVLACAISIEHYVQTKYSNLVYLDFAKLVQEKIASKYFEKSYEISERIAKHHDSMSGKEHRGTLMAQHDMAVSLFFQKKYADSASRFAKMLDPVQGFLGRNSRPSLELAFRLAMVYTKLGKYQEAETLYQQTLEGRKKTRGEELVTFETEYYLAALLHQMEEHERALETVTGLLPKQTEFLGSDHVGTLNTRILKASLLTSSENYDEAHKEVSEVLQTSVAKYGKAHPVTVNAMRQQSHLKIVQGKHNEGLKIFFEVLEIQLRYFVLDPETAMETNRNIGNILVDLKRFDEALRLYAQACDFARAVLDDNDPMTVANEASIGAVLNIQGRVEEALEMYARVYERQKESLGVFHENT